MNIDYERLRKDLIDYFGTAMTIAFPIAMLELLKIEHATNEELIKIAIEKGFDLNNYTFQNIRKNYIKKINNIV